MTLARLTVATACALAVGGCLPPPPGMGPAGEDEADPQEKLRQRVDRLAEQLESLREGGTREGLESLIVEVEALREAVRNQQGRLEVAQHRIKRLGERQRRLYEDVDTRLRSFEQGDSSPAERTGEGGPDDTNAGPAGTVSGSAEDLYQAAFAKIESNEYEEAATGFRTFLEEYPDSDLAPNARYWLGESNYVLRRFEQALVEFNKVLQEYPESPKAPAALLKIGYAFYELGEKGNSRQALQRVRERFPDSAEARLARQRLQKMGDG